MKVCQLEARSQGWYDDRMEMLPVLMKRFANENQLPMDLERGIFFFFKLSIGLKKCYEYLFMKINDLLI